jgi:GntR family transcriptional regulator, transcriptional repressor for pyruvate dehydrogenase complex
MAAHEGAFAPIRQAPAYQLVAESIEREIVEGRLRPGEAIGTEAELTRQFGVNRSTVREGLRCLEQAGLLERETGRRLVVALPSRRKLASRVGRALVLRQATFREVAEAVRVLETATTLLAAERRTQADLDRLSDNLARSREVMDDPAAMSEIEAEFHALVGEAARNQVLQLAREPGGLMIRPATRLIFESSAVAAPRVIEAHEKLLDALARRDAESAGIWIRRHVDDFVKGYARTGLSLDAPLQELGR